MRAHFGVVWQQLWKQTNDLVMEVDSDDPPHRVNRFKVRLKKYHGTMVPADCAVFNPQHQSNEQALKNVHLPSALAQSAFDRDLAVHLCCFFFSCISLTFS